MRTAAVAAALVWALSPASAEAQTDIGFSVERFTPPPGRGQIFVAQDATVLAHLRWTVGATTSLMAAPIELRDINTGEQLSTPVRLRWGADLLAAIGLVERFQVGVGIPVVLAQSGDRLAGIGLDETPLRTTTMGDVRLHAKARVTGRAEARGPALAVATMLSLPTGADGNFAGEKSVVFEALLVASHRAPRWGVVFNLGYRARHRDAVLLSPARPHGNEVVGALGGEVVAYGGLSGLAEFVFVHGATGPAPDVRGPSPVELRFGARMRVGSEWDVRGGFGVGTAPDEVGSPAWRLFVGATWRGGGR